MAKKSKVATIQPQHDKLPLLTIQQVYQWFNRFSWPILRPCRTPHQKESALAIAQSLWFRLVTGTDTEQQIYDDLDEILHHRQEDIVAIGSLYFYRMKTALTQSEQDQLKDYFGRKAHWMQWLCELPSLMQPSSLLH